MKVIDNFMGEYRWLSNFHLCDILYEGILYPSTEHAYQAAKSLYIETRKLFSKDTKPNAWNETVLGPWRPLTCGEAKRKGRKILIRDDWEQIKLKVMFDINIEKYKDDYLSDKLVDTRGCELIEGNTWKDTYWGVCNGVGQNNLGKILMQIRDIHCLERGI